MKIRHSIIIKISAIFVFVFIAAIAIAETSENPERIPDGKFRLEVGEDLSSLDNTMVVRMTLKINPTAHELGTRIQFRYMDKLSHDGWAGQLNKELEHKILFVGQFKEKSIFSEKPILMYTFEHGGAAVSDIQEVPGKSKLNEVLQLTAKSGFYSLGAPLVIGEIAGNPIILSVEPPTKIGG